MRATISPSLLKENPLRSPDWRWQRAVNIADGGPPWSMRRDDVIVKTAANFKRRMLALEQQQPPLSLLRQDPDVFWALWLKLSPDNELVRAELEARFLAGQTSEEISQRCGHSPETLSSYEQLFFDVRTRRPQTTFILHHVIGPEMYTLRDYNHGIVWKLYGYYGGPLVLDALVSQLQGVSRAVTQADVAVFFKHALRGHLTRKSMLAAQTVPVNLTTATEILNVYFRAQEHDTNSGSQPEAGDSLKANLHAFTAAAPWGVVNADLIGVRETRELGYDAAGIELRSADLIGVAAGQAPRGVLPPVKPPEPED